jgi:transposase
VAEAGVAITDLELRMTIKTLAVKGQAARAIARQLRLCEGTVRYHLRRMSEGATDGRSHQVRRAEPYRETIDHWIAQHGQLSNLAALHEWLVAEHDYSGSLRSVQRFVRDAYPPTPRRARRRVETPPGAQAQADWASYPRVIVGGEALTVHAFHLVLSHSRGEALVWAHDQSQLSWLSSHNAAFTRLGGIPAVVRVDNTKTAVAHGAGAWGRLNETYRRYALTVRFHIDPCSPYSPQHKGKVERSVRTGRGRLDPALQTWDSLDELQQHTDALLVESSARRRRCPGLPAPACGRPGRPSAHTWGRCPSCPSPSTTWPPAPWARTRWCTSRDASTRCPLPIWGAKWSCAGQPAWCRSWPTRRSWRSIHATPSGAC